MPPAASRVSRIASHMFIPALVARMPMNSPAEPVMTPAERSNSPPIISSAIATAGMPIVEATSVQFEIPSRVMNWLVVTVKKIATARAAIAAPSSGRRNSFVASETFAMRSSTTTAGAAEPGAVVLMSARPLRCQLLDLGRVALVDEARPGQDRLAAADGVRVGLEQRQEHDRQVALQVLLLVDRELDRAGRDRLHDVAREIEGRELRARARGLDRRRRGGGDVRVERQHVVVGLVGLQLGLDLRLRGREVVGALDLQRVERAAEALLGAVAALLEADVALLVDDAEHLLGAFGLDAGAGRAAGDRLVLADVGDRPELLIDVRARVQGDDRDARRLRLGERALDRGRVRRGDRDAVDLLGHGGVDHLRLL